MRKAVEGKLYRCASKIRDRGNKGKMHLSGKRSRWGEQRVARGGGVGKKEEGAGGCKTKRSKGDDIRLGYQTRRG